MLYNRKRLWFFYVYKKVKLGSYSLKIGNLCALYFSKYMKQKYKDTNHKINSSYCLYTCEKEEIGIELPSTGESPLDRELVY